MEWVDGDDLRTILDRDRRLAPATAVAIVLQTAQALEAVHATMVHRDVKPANIMVSGTGEAAHVYLTDFDKKVKDLSGGQRKRVVCAIELIGNPTMLLLDEPTSGLDPALERRVMTMLRGLADSGRGVAVVTQATSSLAMCDTLAVMAPGGHLLFTGPPRESLKHFQVGAYDWIYEATQLMPLPPPSVISASRNRGSRQRQALLSGHSLLKHTAALTGRYAKTLLRDRRTLAIQLMQAPLMGLLVALLYPRNVLSRPGTQPGRSAQFVFLLVTVALWLGLFDSCREIVKERAIVMRELAVGLRLDAYLISKTALLLMLSALQSILLLVAASVIQPLHASASTYETLGLLLVLASWAAVGFGLVLSTVVRTVDQSTILIPLLLIPQLLFGAALVPFASMQVPVKVVADLMASRWAFAAAGRLIDMNGRFAHTPRGTINAYGTSFFTLTPGAAAAILAGMAAAGLLVATLLLAWNAYRDPN
jgi:ABC transport system ATP-binding/permease protein